MTDIFRNNEQKSRYELEVDGHIAFANYRREGAMLAIPHVEAPPTLRGSGAADRLMRQVMDAARQEALKVVPICGYAASWMERHAQYHDLRA